MGKFLRHCGRGRGLPLKKYLKVRTTAYLFRDYLINSFFLFVGMLQESLLKEFKAETTILRRLRHPNVVLFMGTCTMGRKEMCIVTEFMARGSLHEVLVDDKVDLGWDLLLKMVQY